MLLARRFLPAISVTIASLITAIQTIKKNKEECVRLLEDIHGVLYAIVDLHIKSETPGSIPPTILHYIGRFTETLHKIHTFIEAQQEGLKMKTLFRHAEMNALLKDCRNGLQDAFNVFKVGVGPNLLTNISEMQRKADSLHQELLELISNLSDQTTSDRESSIYHNLNDSKWSSTSFSMLPSQPKIFHGRNSELAQILQMFQQESPRVAILGPGGIGKTSLARAVLHHPDVTRKYEHRFFVSCEAAITAMDVATCIAASLDLKPARDLTRPVIQSLSTKAVALLILDNLESAWEPLASRAGVEEFLSLLTDIPQLVLVTMRGAEHPAKVRWTRPFLQPLKPLSDDAAQQMFNDIADVDFEEINKLLQFTGNMPLAVDLMAHLVAYDGAASVLARWETEKTSLLSEGFDRRSNLDASIAVSLLSPRLSSSPGAMDLLCLLSILPDGLSDVELLQSNLPITNILACKAVLLSTSLAYTDDKRRLKSLVPIREHLQQFHPVQPSLVQCLQDYFQLLLDLYQKFFGTLQSTDTSKQIALNLGNLHQILLQGLKPQNPNLENTVTCGLSLNVFTRRIGRGWHALMDDMKPLLQLCGPKLEILFVTELFNSQLLLAIDEPEPLVSQVQTQFETFHDPVLESHFYSAIGFYYANINNPLKAKEAMEKAVGLVNTTDSLDTHIAILTNVANFHWRFGEYTPGQNFAHQAQRLAQITANLYEEARALRVEAGCNIFLGDYKSTVFSLCRARELLGLCGLSESILDFRVMDLEADIHLRKSEYAEARQIYLHIANKLTEENNPIDHAYALQGIGETDVATNAQNPTQNLEKARSLFASHNFHMGAFACEAIIAGHVAKQKDMVAKDLKITLEKCLAGCWGDDPLSTFCVLEQMGDSSRWPATEFHWAATYAVVYLAFAAKKKEKLRLHTALRYVGDVFLENGDEATARNIFIAALDGFTSMDVHYSRAECMIRLGDLARNHGDSATATVFWSTARPLYKRALQARGVADIDQRLATLKQGTS
ncbi:hypothetical protein B0H14DRAFT_1192585 [Mycena olivaceomarginata]|nr:hypothetical protein B0H14DRAFT_1192585 [Mycena olivaceomarginata]